MSTITVWVGQGSWREGRVVGGKKVEFEGEEIGRLGLGFGRGLQTLYQADDGRLVVHEDNGEPESWEGWVFEVHEVDLQPGGEHEEWAKNAASAPRSRWTRRWGWTKPSR